MARRIPASDQRPRFWALRVYAFISPETNTAIPSGNVVAIAGDDGVLVVNSGRFPTLARKMMAEIRLKTGQPVRYLVHTHWHLPTSVSRCPSSPASRSSSPG